MKGVIWKVWLGRMWCRSVTWEGVVKRRVWKSIRQFRALLCMYA